MHFFQEPTRGARKRKKHVADVLRKEGGTRSSEGENLQSMHHRSSMAVSARVLDIVVDRVIVSRNRLESGVFDRGTPNVIDESCTRLRMWACDAAAFYRTLPSMEAEIDCTLQSNSS
jgi:hypothetical protein